MDEVYVPGGGCAGAAAVQRIEAQELGTVSPEFGVPGIRVPGIPQCPRNSPGIPLGFDLDKSMKRPKPRGVGARGRHVDQKYSSSKIAKNSLP